jgi:uncharacterized membrane protein YczE
MTRYTPRRLGLLVLGCVVLGIGVGLLLTADLGSDGYSTLVNGIHLEAGIPFVVANTGVGVAFIAAAMMRRLFPDVGTVIQVVLVGLTVGVVLDNLDTPAAGLARTAYLVAALPILAVGVALYLGSRLGAGPAEAAALAWDPPVPFRWSYSAMQGSGALVGWLLGAAIGPGTMLVIVGLGPAVDMMARTLRLDISPARG